MPSSVVRSMHYDPNYRRLRIVYISGKVYDYFGVPAAVYEAMKTSDSKGTFLNTRIKGHYDFREVK